MTTSSEEFDMVDDDVSDSMLLQQIDHYIEDGKLLVMFMRERPCQDLDAITAVQEASRALARFRSRHL